MSYALLSPSSLKLQDKLSKDRFSLPSSLAKVHDG